MHFLSAGGGHLLADDALHLCLDAKAEWKPCEDTRGLATDVSGAQQQPMARHLGVGRVFSKSPKEKV
jgi:hypothetical protein